MNFIVAGLVVASLATATAHAQSVTQFGKDDCLSPPGCSSQPAPLTPQGVDVQWIPNSRWSAELGLSVVALASFKKGNDAIGRGELAARFGASYRLGPRSSGTFTESIARSLRDVVIGNSLGFHLSARQQLPVRTAIGLGPTSMHEVTPRLRVSSLLGVLPEFGVIVEASRPAMLYLRSSVGVDWLVGDSWLLGPRALVTSTFANGFEIGAGGGVEVTYCFGCSTAR